MQRLDDERLVAYLDGELETAQRRDVEAWLDADPAARQELAALADSTHLLRLAYDEVLHERLPDRLIATARGEPIEAQAGARILPFHGRAGARTVIRTVMSNRWWITLPVAASLFGLLVGGGAAYLGIAKLLPDNTAGKRPAVEAAAANGAWLDNAAGYFKLFVSAGDNPALDVTATGDPREELQKISQSLPQKIQLPDLKPWGLSFRGAKLVVAEGRPAAELVYTTDNKAIGPLTLIIGSSKLPNISPTFDRRQDVNLLYWRHQGRAYALVGQAEIGYLWGIANDVAWQLDAI
jgi:anti-sigma factor RsiW